MLLKMLIERKLIMTNRYVLVEKCPKCFGLGKTLNPPRKKLNIVEKTVVPEELDDPIFFVCTECKGTGKILPDEVKELLEYILS